MADPKSTLAQNDDPATQAGQTPAAADQAASGAQGAVGQQGLGQDAQDVNMSGSTAAGYGQTGFSGDMGGSGQIAGNDQAGGGLGQNQTGYGGGNYPADATPTSGESVATTHDAQQQGSQGIGAQGSNLGASPTGGGQQPRSATTGGPDLSKGLADANKGGGI